MSNDESLARTLEERRNERLDLITKLHDTEKKSFREIGAAIGTSATRASQLYHKAKRIAKQRGTDPYYGLSARAVNCLYNAGLMNRQQVEDALEDGRLHPTKVNSCRNYGWKTHIEVHRWLGLPEPQQRKPQLKVCPHCGGKLTAEG